MKRLYCTLSALMLLVAAFAQPRELVCFDKGWEFAFGNASSPALDFGCGTEYGKHNVTVSLLDPGIVLQEIRIR